MLMQLILVDQCRETSGLVWFGLVWGKWWIRSCPSWVMCLLIREEGGEEGK